ncbi:MAG: amidohydrolase [Anaerolineae bacterium]|jgi:5-methylthioadenosine/S-adenosylhomocysteine deaminase
MVSKATDLLVKGGCVVTVDEEMRFYSPGSVAVDQGRIVAVGPSPEIDKSFSPERVIDASSKVIMPGLFNCHTHACITYLRGMADDMALYEWLDEKIWPAINAQDEEVTYHSVLLGCLEMIRAGITTFCEMCVFTPQVVAAIDESGLRADVADEKKNFGDQTKIPSILAEAADWYDRFHGSGEGRIRMRITAHAPYSCTPELVRGLLEVAAEREALLKTHLAETQDEVEEIQRDYGVSPTVHMDNLGFLGPKTLVAHAIWLMDEDIRVFAERGVTVAHDPTSNMKLTAGICPVPKLLDQGVTVGLGTDSVVSNNRLDLFEAMKTTALIHKVVHMDPTLLPAEQVVQLATRGGAEALGLIEEVGTVEVGKKADLILVDFDKPHLRPHHLSVPQNVYSHLVYSAVASDVDTTIVDGHVLMENRRVRSLDEGEVIAQAQRSAESLLRQAGLL